jgi:BolA family transcriptional regulator, general stress-responsive regulator
MTDTDRVALIKEKLNKALAPTHLDIIDESHKHAGHAGARKGGGHFTVTIVSPQFTGKTLVQRHRMVYAAVEELMNTAIHALSINAQTPEEFSSSP